MLIDPADRQQDQPVPRYARIDVIGGFLLAAVALLIWLGTIELEIGEIADIKAGALPRLLSAILAIAGIGLFLEGLLQAPGQGERLMLAIRPAALVILSIVVFGLFIRAGKFGLVTTPQLGLLVVGPLTVFIAGCAATEIHLKNLLILAFGLTAALLLIFVDLLSVNIPVYPKQVADFLLATVGEFSALRIAYAGYAIIAFAVYILPEQGRG